MRERERERESGWTKCINLGIHASTTLLELFLSELVSGRCNSACWSKSHGQNSRRNGTFMGSLHCRQTLQKCRKIHGLGCVNHVGDRVRVTQTSPRISQFGQISVGQLCNNRQAGHFASVYNVFMIPYQLYFAIRLPNGDTFILTV